MPPAVIIETAIYPEKKEMEGAVMDIISLLVGIVSAVLCVGSFALLISNCGGACVGLISVAACVGIVVFSVVAAAGLKKCIPGKK